MDTQTESAPASAQKFSLPRAWAPSVCVLIYAFICTFPGDYSPVQPGLDASWKYGLSYLAGSQYVFGRDVTFTYGPLGFLLNPLEVGSCLVAGVLFWVGLQLCLFACVAARLRKAPHRLALFCACYVLVIGLGLWPEYRVMAVIAVLVLLSLEESPASVGFGVAAALSSLAASQMKWSMGISALSLVAGSWLLLFLKRSRDSRRTALAGILAFAAGLVLVIFLLYRSPYNFWLWARTSMELAAGYSSAMSLTGPVGVLLLASLAAQILIQLFFSLTWQTRSLLLLFTAPAVFAFKHGFVRQGGHSMAFFSAIALIPAVLFANSVLPARDAKRVLTAFVAVFAVALVYGANYLSYPALSWTDFRALLSLRTGLSHLSGAVHLAATRASLRAAATPLLRTSVLAEGWETRLIGARVSIVPWELSIAAANRVNLQPLPTLQLYSAYTPALDAATAAALAQGGAEYLIAKNEGADYRNMLLDTPATWRVIFGHYQIVDSDPVERRALLVRKPARMETLNPKSAGSASLEEWVPVPETDHLLYQSLNLEYTAFGATARVFYQAPAVQLELKHKSGRLENYRLLSETAINGILINYPPATQNEFEDLLRGYGRDPVTQFRVLAPSRYFSRQYVWHLSQSSRQLVERHDEPKPPEITSFAIREAKGLDALFEISVADANGAGNLQFVQMILNRGLNGAGACYLSYEAPENRLWLIADSGRGAAGVGRVGEQTTLANSQCTVAMGGVRARASGNSLTLQLPIRFATSFSGVRQAYVEVIDLDGLHPKFQAKGVWEAR